LINWGSLILLLLEGDNSGSKFKTKKRKIKGKQKVDRGLPRPICHRHTSTVLICLPYFFGHHND